MERKTTLRKRVVVILTVLVGIASIAFGLHLYSWRDAQVEFYNRGLVAYRTGDVQQAIKFFDQSLSVYKSRVNREGWQERVLYPGLSEAEEVVHRRAEGIPLHKEVLQWFAECTSELGVAPLESMS